MKKAILCLVMFALATVSCRKDEDTIVPEVEITTQNSYDDQAVQKYLQTHYLDSKGNVKDFAEGDTVNVKLIDMEPVTLPSGAVYIVRPGAQPEPGTPIGSTDIIHLMGSIITYVATETDGKVGFNSPYPFINTLTQTGVPQEDPAYYYVKQSVLDAASAGVAKERSYYEIEGFREALQKFKAFDLPEDADYNLQGVIIVPSRAAFARDAHFNYNNISLRNRSFVFNFQVYKSMTRP